MRQVFTRGKALARLEIPDKVDKRSFFSAGKTEVPALYHFGDNSAYVVTPMVMIKTNQNKKSTVFDRNDNKFKKRAAN